MNGANDLTGFPEGRSMAKRRPAHRLVPRAVTLLAALVFVAPQASCRGREEPPTGPKHSVAAFWSGTAGGVHFHITLLQQGAALALDPAAGPGRRTLYPLDAAGVAALSTRVEVEITSLSGTFADPAIEFTLHFPVPGSAVGGQLTYTGTVDDSVMVGRVSGPTMPAAALVLRRGHPD